MFNPLRKLRIMMFDRDQECKAWINDHVVVACMTKPMYYPEGFDNVDELIKRDMVRQMAESIADHIQIKKNTIKLQNTEMLTYEAKVYFIVEEKLNK